jgi:hypothetical protein
MARSLRSLAPQGDGDGPVAMSGHQSLKIFINEALRRQARRSEATGALLFFGAHARGLKFTVKN